MQHDRPPIEQLLADIPEISFADTVHQLMSQRVKTAPVIHSDEAIEAMETYKTGFIEPAVFDAMFHHPAPAEDNSDDEYEDDNTSFGGDGDSEGSFTTVSWDTVLDGERMEVCSKFLKDECSLNACPLAHPGVRDRAKIFYAK